MFGCDFAAVLCKYAKHSHFAETFLAPGKRVSGKAIRKQMAYETLRAASDMLPTHALHDGIPIIGEIVHKLAKGFLTFTVLLFIYCIAVFDESFKVAALDCFLYSSGVVDCTFEGEQLFELFFEMGAVHHKHGIWHKRSEPAYPFSSVRMDKHILYLIHIISFVYGGNNIFDERIIAHSEALKMYGRKGFMPFIIGCIHSRRPFEISTFCCNEDHLFLL